MGILCGALQVASVGYSYLSWQLPTDKIQQDVILSGQVLSSRCDIQTGYSNEVNEKDGVNFHRYTVSNFSFIEQRTNHPWKLSISESTLAPCMQAGDIFQGIVRIKPAYASANPVGFNGQRFFLANGIVATGYIKYRNEELLWHTHDMRSQFSQFLSAMGLSQHGLLQALLLGNRQYMTPTEWDILQRTGTSHIFSISGMHLGIIVGGVLCLLSGMFVVGRWLGLPIDTSANARGCLFSIVVVVAGAYAWLSGLGIPVVRAWWLLCIAMLLANARWIWRPHHVAVVMLFLCILVNPMSVLQTSLYLSVIAVFLIWLVYWRYTLSRFNGLVALLLLQISLSVLIAPITLLWFGSFSVSSLVANTILVPVISLILPICLLVFLICYCLANGPLYEVFAEVMELLNWVIEKLMDFLHYLSKWEGSAFSVSSDALPVVCLMAGVLWLILMPGRPKPLLVLPLIVPVFFIGLPSSPSLWFVHVLDVGQGTAVVVTSGSRAVVIDTGPAFAQQAVISSIVPELFDTLNITTTDYVIVSHEDTDHSGGSQFLSTWLNDNNHTPQWISPVDGCEQGREVAWNGLSIRFLWPPVGNQLNNNASSCVVHISDGKHSILFPGDIDRTSEYAILNSGVEVRADVALSAHHGSRTSSTKVWVETVDANEVIHTQSYENRWKFPHRDVFNIFARHETKQYLVSESGYIRVSFSDNNYRFDTLRQDLTPRWYMRSLPARHLSGPP